MSDDGSHVYSDQEPNTSYVGDPFVGVPVSRDIVESVAAQYSVKSSSLARALRDVRNSSVIDLGTLFTGFDPLPVGCSEDGLLYVLVEENGCWDAVASQIGLTKDGRDAAAAAHSRQVSKVVEGEGEGNSSGLVVSCSEFPVDAINDIVSVSDKTRLTNRQTTIWILSQYLPSDDAISHLLSMPPSIVKSELASVDRVTRQSAVETKTLDVPGTLTRLKPEPQSPEWMGLEWSSWFSLRDQKTLREELPRRPGLYRVRHSELPGLMYIGESGSEGGVRQRVGLGLSAGVSELGQQAGDKHGAARALRQITDFVGGEMEVSVTTPPISSNRKHRRAVEATLIAVCRREVGWTPMVQLNREPAENVSGSRGKLDRKLKNVAQRFSYSPPSWQPWRDVTGPNWLGLDWSESRPLSKRDEINNGGVHAFRLWRGEAEDQWGQTIEEIGTTRSISSRLFKLQSEYEDDMRFSVVSLDELSSPAQRRSRELGEVRHDLVGAHYLATGAPPKAQF